MAAAIPAAARDMTRNGSGIQNWQVQYVVHADYSWFVSISEMQVSIIGLLSCFTGSGSTAINSCPQRMSTAATPCIREEPAAEDASALLGKARELVVGLAAVSIEPCPNSRRNHCGFVL